MADLTDEMKEFLNSNLAWVATISKEGQVDLGPKMSMFIHRQQPYRLPRAHRGPDIP